MKPATRIRQEQIDNVTQWTWLAKDDGAWDGPKNDWITSHREKYLKHCKSFRTVLCAGGNQGMYPRLFSDIFSKVYTFEPDFENFYCLSQNCYKENIIKINAALGDCHKMISLNRPCENNTGMNNINLEQEGIIPQLCVDDFEIRDLDLMQLDVEGYELSILMGAVNTIALNSPIIATEHERSEVSDFLKLYGYSIVERSVADVVYAIL